MIKHELEHTSQDNDSTVMTLSSHNTPWYLLISRVNLYVNTDMKLDNFTQAQTSSCCRRLKASPLSMSFSRASFSLRLLSLWTSSWTALSSLSNLQTHTYTQTKTHTAGAFSAISAQHGATINMKHNIYIFFCFYSYWHNYTNSSGPYTVPGSTTVPMYLQTVCVCVCVCVCV